MIYILGILTGLVVSVLIVITISYFKTPIERTLNQTVSMLKQKGAIIEPDNEQITSWLDELPSEPHENKTS